MTLTPQRRCAQRLLGAEDFKPRGYTGDNSLYLEVISTWTEHGRFLLYVHDPCAFWFAHHFTITAGSFFFYLCFIPVPAAASTGPVQFMSHSSGQHSFTLFLSYCTRMDMYCIGRTCRT